MNLILDCVDYKRMVLRQLPIKEALKYIELEKSLPMEVNTVDNEELLNSFKVGDDVYYIMYFWYRHK